MIKVEVDFNSIVGKDKVSASRRRADGDLIPGTTVLAVDSAEGMEFEAVVESVDDTTGRALLKVHWSDRGPVQGAIAATDNRWALPAGVSFPTTRKAVSINC